MRRQVTLGEGGMAHRGDGRCVRRREGVRLVVVLVRLRGGGVGSDGKFAGTSGAMTWPSLDVERCCGGDGGVQYLAGDDGCECARTG